MTTGLKTPSSYYMELITTFPPRPITCEAELTATQNSLLDLQINSAAIAGILLLTKISIPRIYKMTTVFLKCYFR